MCSRALRQTCPSATGNVTIAYAAEGGVARRTVSGPYSPFATAFLNALKDPGADIAAALETSADVVRKATGGGLSPALGNIEAATGVYFQDPVEVASLGDGGAIAKIQALDAIVVDAAGGGDFTSLQEAVNAAGEKTPS